MTWSGYSRRQRLAILAALALLIVLGSAIPSWAICISETLDLGSCDRCLAAETERQSDGSWSRECVRWRKPAPSWSTADRAAAGYAIFGMAADVASTAYFMHAGACGGRIRESNVLVPNVGVLAAMKLALAGTAYILGESSGARYRARTWALIGTPQYAIAAWNLSLISKHC